MSLGSEYSSLLCYVHYEFLSESAFSNFIANLSYIDVTEDIWDGIIQRIVGNEDFELKSRRFSKSQPDFALESQPRRDIDSLIISTIPSIFNDFGNQSYQLLYRGSRDGFDCANEHAKVDGHSNTITLVETTEGFIFGGYTPCQWDSSDTWKADESHRSFLFTLKNPHNIPARTFLMKPEQKLYAMCCHSTGCLVWIGHYGAIGILPDCNSNSKSHNDGFGHSSSSFVNDTGLDGKTLFTGKSNFRVKELEIFELTE
jgi:hypothetical protein